MTTTCYGRVLDELGHAGREELEHGQLRYRGWSTRASEVRDIQPNRIPVTYGHTNQELGEVQHLERRTDGSLWAVATLEDFQPEVLVQVGAEARSVPVDLYWSALYSSTDDRRDIELVALALTPRAAQVATPPVEFLPGGLDTRNAPARWNLRPTYTRDLLFRAAASRCNRRWHHGSPIVVHDGNAERLYERATPREMVMALEEQAMRRPPGPLRYSTPVKGSVIDVR